MAVAVEVERQHLAIDSISYVSIRHVEDKEKTEGDREKKGGDEDIIEVTEE